MQGASLTTVRARISRFLVERLKPLVKESGTLALGEGVAKLSAMVTLALVSRKLGIAVMGSMALAQTIAVYVVLLTDSGARHAGARLVAASPSRFGPIRERVQVKRTALGLLAALLGYLYGRYGPIPENARSMVSLYALAAWPYCLSLDWILWGTRRYFALSVSRVLTSLLPLLVIGGALLARQNAAFAIPLSGFVGYAAGSAYSRWRVTKGRTLRSATAADIGDARIDAETQWRAVLLLGAALVCNQIFNSVDALLLGAMSSIREVALMILGVYYLLTTILYPRMAAVSESARTRRHLAPYLLMVFGAGLVAAALVMVCSSWVVSIIYGHAFLPASRMLLLLAMVIPLDFVTSLCSITLVAWGLSKRVLTATAVAAVVNVVMNVYWIPGHGAFGACWATLGSYLVLLAVLLKLIPRRGSATDHSGGIPLLTA
jgi:O-antigen/teichoic acid export membrane protein